METYTLELSEDAEVDELLARLYDIDGLIEASERVAYEDFALSPDRTEGEAPERTREVTVDVTTLDLQLTRVEGAFEARVLGDGEERITDEEWGLARSE